MRGILACSLGAVEVVLHSCIVVVREVQFDRNQQLHNLPRQPCAGKEVGRAP